MKSKKNKLTDKVLVLNTSREFLGTKPLYKAIKDVVTNQVIVLESTDRLIKGGINKHGVQTEMAAPTVICEREYVNVKYDHLFKISYSPENVKLRDRYTCQYCHNKFKEDELNIDHVHPKCEGGKLTWTNSVATCFSCNTIKGSQSLKECGFSLRKMPIKPSGFSEYLRLKVKTIPESWEQYLY